MLNYYMPMLNYYMPVPGLSEKRELRNLEITYNVSPNVFYTVSNRSKLHSKNLQVIFIIEQDNE